MFHRTSLLAALALCFGLSGCSDSPADAEYKRLMAISDPWDRFVAIGNTSDFMWHSKREFDLHHARVQAMFEAIRQSNQTAIKHYCERFESADEWAYSGMFDNRICPSIGLPRMNRLIDLAAQDQKNQGLPVLSREAVLDMARTQFDAQYMASPPRWVFASVEQRGRFEKLVAPHRFP